MAKRAVPTVAERSLTSARELVPGQVSTLSLDSGIVSPLRLRCVNVVRVFSCNLPPAFLAE